MLLGKPSNGQEAAAPRVSHAPTSTDDPCVSSRKGPTDSWAENCLVGSIQHPLQSAHFHQINTKENKTKHPLLIHEAKLALLSLKPPVH